jgi:hypothetical protein
MAFPRVPLTAGVIFMGKRYPIAFFVFRSIIGIILVPKTVQWETPMENLNNIAMFLKVVETGSFSAAAALRQA